MRTLEEIERDHAATTQGKWVLLSGAVSHDVCTSNGRVICRVYYPDREHRTTQQGINDAGWIARAHQYVPNLIAQMRELEEAGLQAELLAERVRALRDENDRLRKFVNDFAAVSTCHEMCGTVDGVDVWILKARDVLKEDDE